MAFDSSQTQKIQTWLNAKLPGGCAVCHQKNFALADIIAPPTFSNGNVNMGGEFTPMLPVVCNGCAHVMLFAAKPIGIV